VAATAASDAGSAALVGELDVVAEVVPPPLDEDDDADDDELLLPHPATAATQSSATAAASQPLLVRIATPSSLDHPEPGRRIGNNHLQGAKR
jgi:hypothetical protein